MIGFTEHINNDTGGVRKGEARKADLLHIHELFSDITEKLLYSSAV